MQTTVLHWTCATLHAIRGNDAEVLCRLVNIAGQKAKGLDATTRRNGQKDWVTWLNRGTPKSDAKGLKPTKRAFLYVKGPTGWAKPMIASQQLEDDIPDLDLPCEGKPPDWAIEEKRVW